jgi:D-alanine-D-alanine ligase
LSPLLALRGLRVSFQTPRGPARAVDGIPALIEALRAGSVDRVFNILHGNKGGGDQDAS